MNTQLRPAKKIDAQQLAKLWVDTFPDKFGVVLGGKAIQIIENWLILSERHLATTVVAEANNEVVGFVMCETSSSPPVDGGRWLWQALRKYHGRWGSLTKMLHLALIDDRQALAEGVLHIELLGVAPAYRQQGVGQQLLTHVQYLAYNEQLHCLTLSVKSNNLSAIRFYARFGFKIVEQKLRRHPKWPLSYDPYYTMRKTLS
ncbi:MAG: GNAT family N-acetyltransferase [Chloroflexota bacterium]